MPDESPSNNEPEGSKDGRQWTSAEISAFPGFLNDERNEGALQPAEHYHELLKRRANSWTINFRRGLGDTTQLFAPSSDASKTIGGCLKKYPMPREQMDGASQMLQSFFFSDEPDAGRMILPAKVMSDRRSPRNGSEIPLDADDDRISDLDEPDSIGSTTGSPATLTSTATLVSDASELGAESCVVSPRPLRKLIGHEFACHFQSWSHELRGSILQRSLNSFVVQKSWKGEDLGTGPLTTIFGAFG
ncbi:hypothetical protein E4U57_001772 [Claviceps arundinis]|uniref:Uncharacterized protein n=1 Tax=Claviceps arundinis TaxID=1623583 RepID=A0A9P7MSY4_9HYPO|nr:hypothetical protein E4U57_001772 [Claviceps arundinis]KAG5968170.1 hypothetical protein E4U56_000452 [Claviceps arundinis]